ncbi:hypothetical protein ASF06_04460 [Agreia sp. Leaf244]|uniref:septum formation family protein n=1 Tax=Agreia sp. Leaf244 TaxID=1736305 RepID=UPI0006F8C746|nr:septum formation family protein [Agreia sp. Leaf244]KQO11876.1 hypothetical protein ASF06_04460 [Agreia sp. Leaf244]
MPTIAQRTFTPLAALSLMIGLFALTGCSVIDSVTPKDEAVRDDETSEVTEAGQADVFTVAVGDCFNDVSSEEISEVPVVPCDQPHDFEAYSAFDLAGDDFPGDDAVTQQAGDGCTPAFAEFNGVGYDDSTLYLGYLLPTEDSWTEQGDREVLCYIYEENVKTTGTLQGAAR